MQMLLDHNLETKDFFFFFFCWKDLCGQDEIKDSNNHRILENFNLSMEEEEMCVAPLR